MRASGAGRRVGASATARPRAWPPAVAARARYWGYQYKRTWRSSVTTSFLYPGPLPGRHGGRAGLAVDKHSARRRRRELRRLPGPGAAGRHRMQIGTNDATYPVMGAIKWVRTYFAMLARPLDVYDVLRGHLAWIAARLAIVCHLPGRHGRLRHRPLALGRPGPARRRADRHGLRRPRSPPSPPPRTRTRLLHALPLRHHPDCSSSRGPSSRPQLPGWLQLVAYATPLYHGVTLCRGLTLGHSAGADWACRLPGRAGRDAATRSPGGARRQRLVTRVGDRRPTPPGGAITPMACLGCAGARPVVERNILVYRRVDLHRLGLLRAALLPALHRHRSVALVGAHPRRRPAVSPTPPSSPRGCWPRRP